MYSFIELLRALAAMLITNSHFDGVYPWNISWGGCPGVALLFTISGFLLVSSVKKKDFLPWWSKKVIRLYIPLAIVNIITVIIGFRSASVSLFLFPIMINLVFETESSASMTITGDSAVVTLTYTYNPPYIILLVPNSHLSTAGIIEGNVMTFEDAGVNGDLVFRKGE